MTATAHASSGQHRPLDLLREVLASSRPLSWVNTAYPFAAAYVLVTGGVDTVLVVGALWFLVPYNLLMYGVNDVFDYESDLRNPRKGGVEGVVLDRSVHRLTITLAVVGNLPFVGYLLVVGDAVSALVLAVSVFAVVAYSAPVLRFKERPFLDSLTSSTHFVSPAVLGLALAHAPVTTGTVAAVLGFFLWGVGSHSFGAVQDIEADRAGGIGSVGTVLGAASTVRFAALAYVAGGVALTLCGWPGALAALLVLPYVVNVAPYLRITDATCERAHDGWRRFLWLNYVTGFLLTQLLIWIALR